MKMYQTKRKDYQHVLEYLRQKAMPNPLSASYDVLLSVNEVRYILKLQPHRRQHLVALQAISYSDTKPNQHTLVTDGTMLRLLLELFVLEAVRN